jgi:hypothetical protein
MTSGSAGSDWAGTTIHSVAERPAIEVEQQLHHPVAQNTEPVRQPDAPTADPRSRIQRRRARRRQRTRIVAQLVAVLAVLAGVLTLVLVRTGGTSPTKRTESPGAAVSGASLADPQTANGFLGAAASDIAAVTTYDYRHLDDALNAGLTVTTGAYRAAYRAALTGDLARTAAAEHVVHTFEVLDIGIGEISANGSAAKVLVFGRQRVTDDQTGSHTRVSPITLCATIQHHGNRYLISKLVEGANAGLPPGGAQLPVAADAARTEVVNTLSYRRDTFDADLQRALDAATSPLREQIRRSSSDLEKAMTKGGYDTTGTVTALGVVRADPETATLLVAADESRVANEAGAPRVIKRRYEVTVTRTVDGWAASRISSVDGGS